MLSVNLALAGLAIGCVVALAGIGLVVTYRATGVFNIAFGAIAMLVAYLLWQAVRVWRLPLWPSALVDLLVVAPGIGVLLDALVFSPLQRRAAPAVERLVASLGVFVLMVGAAYLGWGGQARTDAPQLLPSGGFALGNGLTVPASTLASLGVVLAIVAALGAVTKLTPFGIQVRAVVNRRTLAELTGINAPLVSRAGWAAGSFLAGLAGVLLAPGLRLDPYGLTLVVLESMSVALAARLTSVPFAAVFALALGIGQSELTQLQLDGAAGDAVRALSANLPAVALLLVALALPRFEEAGVENIGRAALLSKRRDLPSVPGWWVIYVIGLALPLDFATGTDLTLSLQVPALAVIFVSLVLVTGYGGQISFGTAGFAGLGALLTGQLSGTIPTVPALLVAAIVVTPVGMLTGVPAIRQRGLLVMFSTFAVATVVSRFVFQEPWATDGLQVTRRGPLGDDHVFYLFELLCLGVALVFVRNLHVGRVGRALLAMRDNEAGAAASGVDVGRLKVFVFGISAGLAAVGGGLLTLGARAFDPAAYDPLQGLLWFAAVVVFGADSVAGAVLAAALVISLDSAVTAGASDVVIGLLAVLLGYSPGGVAGLRRWLTAQEVMTATPGPSAQEVVTAMPRLSARGRAVRRRLEARR
jgi:branched-chain amino acid transport system permease protein